MSEMNTPLSNIRRLLTEKDSFPFKSRIIINLIQIRWVSRSLSIFVFRKE